MDSILLSVSIVSIGEIPPSCKNMWSNYVPVNPHTDHNPPFHTNLPLIPSYTSPHTPLHIHLFTSTIYPPLPTAAWSKEHGALILYAWTFHKYFNNWSRYHSPPSDSYIASSTHSYLYLVHHSITSIFMSYLHLQPCIPTLSSSHLLSCS